MKNKKIIGVSLVSLMTLGATALAMADTSGRDVASPDPVPQSVPQNSADAKVLEISGQLAALGNDESSSTGVEISGQSPTNQSALPDTHHVESAADDSHPETQPESQPESQPRDSISPDTSDTHDSVDDDSPDTHDSSDDNGIEEGNEND